MELDMLRKKALEEYTKQRQEVRKSREKLFGVWSSMLTGIGCLLLVFAAFPPFWALATLLGRGTTYLLPDGTKIMSDTFATLIVGNQTLERVMDFRSEGEIGHYLLIAGVVSGIMCVVAVILFLVSSVMEWIQRARFVEQYIFEHSKDKKEGE